MVRLPREQLSMGNVVERSIEAVAWAGSAVVRQLASDGPTSPHIVDRLRYHHDERELAISLSGVVVAQEALLASSLTDASFIERARLSAMVHTNLQRAAELTGKGFYGQLTVADDFSLAQPEALPLLNRSVSLLSGYFPAGEGLDQLDLKEDHHHALLQNLPEPPLPAEYGKYNRP